MRGKKLRISLKKGRGIKASRYIAILNSKSKELDLKD
jgi:hypothetical protein